MLPAALSQDRRLKLSSILFPIIHYFPSALTVPWVRNSCVRILRHFLKNHHLMFQSTPMLVYLMNLDSMMKLRNTWQAPCLNGSTINGSTSLVVVAEQLIRT